MNQQQIQNGLKYTLAQINHIYWIGIELEGYWANGHSCIKGDSSVEFENYSNSECNGDCIHDSCECSSYCECNDCKKCEICDNEINDCDCDLSPLFGQIGVLPIKIDFKPIFECCIHFIQQTFRDARSFLNNLII